MRRLPGFAPKPVTSVRRPGVSAGESKAGRAAFDTPMSPSHCFRFRAIRPMIFPKPFMGHVLEDEKVTRRRDNAPYGIYVASHNKTLAGAARSSAPSWPGGRQEASRAPRP